MALPPIKLSLNGEDIYLVPSRELGRWGGYLHGRRSAYQLVTPDNASEIRLALTLPRGQDTEAVFVELSKQLEDGSALFFELPLKPVAWDAPEEIDIFDLIPSKGDDDTRGDRPTPETGLHWIEVVCVGARGGSYSGAKARLRLPDGRSESVTLDGRSSLRFDDLTESGTVHFELASDAVAHGEGTPTPGHRYELGSPIGLVTRKRHVLVVHPNPRAFVSVELFVDDEPVSQGSYTLSTKLGDDTGGLNGEAVQASGFALPSAATFAFDRVLLPPPPDEQPEDPIRPDGPDDPPPGPDGPTPGPDGPIPVGPDPEPDRPDDPANLGHQLRVRLVDMQSLAVILKAGGQTIEAVTDAEGLLDVEVPQEAHEAQLLVPSRGEVYTLQLGALEPATTLRGASSRLRNLGLYSGQPTDSIGPVLRDAIRTFQLDHALPVTGELDPPTAEALESAHGS